MDINCSIINIKMWKMGFMNYFRNFFLIFFIFSIQFVFSTENFQEDEFERIILGEASPPQKELSSDEILYLQPNTTQLFTELYKHYGLLNNPQLNVIERAPYLNQTGAPTPFPLQPADQAILNRTEALLKEFHTRSGNLDLFLEPGNQESFFYTANGSIQIIYALVYAIATTFPNQNFLFVEKIPFYPGHHAAVALLFHYPNVRWQGFRDPSEITLLPGETLIEFVTSPNNPDGVFRKPETNANTIIADFVFASSTYGDGAGYLDANLAWVNEARVSGKNVFSFNSASKQFGKTGCRCGYLWFPLNQTFSSTIFPQFFNFISLSTIGSGTSGLSEFLNLITALLEQKGAGRLLRKDAHASLVKRYHILNKEILRRYPGSINISVSGSPALFIHLSDPRIPKTSASAIIFEDTRSSVSGGTAFGENAEFFRVSLTGYSGELAEFANRLAGFKKYRADDFFKSSVNVCPSVKIDGSRGEKIRYVANPNNCVIKADASRGEIVIELPDFIDYNLISITIKKTDRSKHQVKVKSRTFTRILTKKSPQIEVQWYQPNFLDGHWTVRE